MLNRVLAATALALLLPVVPAPAEAGKRRHGQRLHGWSGRPCYRSASNGASPEMTIAMPPSRCPIAKRGESQWRAALPLLRIGGERVTGYPSGPSRYGVRATSIYDYTAPNMFAGSILNLEPDTDYECRFVLSDPDGVGGTVEQNVTVHTRRAPAPAAGGHVYHVYPSGYKGAVQEPAFYSLMGAYYLGADESDHSIAYPARVQPGDIILVHAGVYKDARYDYSGFDPQGGGLRYAVRRHLFPHRQRYARQAHRDQGGRRR